MADRGRVRETYHAAIRHDLVELTGEEDLVGVVRRPTGWFRSAVDENYRELGPPEALLDDVKAAQEDLAMQGLCAEEAHNAAWPQVNFAARYREYVAGSEAVDARLEELADRVRDGREVVLVCYEGDDKRCHRRLLQDLLEDRLAE
jgi:uncharacterized protein YeaO (DUF488 family)